MKYFTFFILAFALNTYGQTTNVQFLVNMNYQISQGHFNPATQSVDIAGTFNTWGAPTTVLSDSDSDGIYTVTVPLAIGSTILFKTRIDAHWDGTEEFPGGGPNRSYIVAANGIVQYWYNDAVPPDLLDVRIEASSAVIQPNEMVHFSDLSTGNPVGWNWSFPGGTPSESADQNPVVSYASAGTYSVTLTITSALGDVMTRTFTNYIRVDPMQTFWWNDSVFYEVFVRSFKDSNGDGKGDIQGLISKLDYLNDGNPATTDDLGITALWLMPIQQSPSYHGYDVTDYRTVETDYGTNADFTALIAAAHARGIKVIIDMVMNHTSSAHPWFVASTNPASDKRDWYIWHDTNPGTPGPFDNNPWHLLNGDYFYGCFYEGMPDLNFYNQEVRDEFQDITSFWLNNMGADGFRLDAANVLMENATMTRNTPETIAYWHQFRDYYKSVNPDAYAIGEVGEYTEDVQQYVNNNGLDNCFEFQLSYITMDAFSSGNAIALRNKLREITVAYPFLQYGTFLTNHDIDRAMSQFQGDVTKAKAAASLLLTLPGVPYIYYGEEIGMTGVKPDQQIRTPMQWNAASGAGFTSGTPWESINADYTTKNVAAQQSDPASLWTHYHKLVGIRNHQAALTKGTYKEVSASSTSVMAYLRQYEGENVLVVINVGYTALANVTLSITNGGIVPGNYTMTELLGGNPVDMTVGSDGGFNLEIASIPVRGTLIYKLGNQLATNNFASYSARIYPVPANDYVDVVLSGTASGSATYSIADISGRQLSNGSFDFNSGQSQRILLNYLPNGVYFIRLNAGGKTSVSKFVVE